LKLLDSVGDLKNLWLFVPDKPLDLKGQYLFNERGKIKSLLVDLYVKDYNGLGDWLWLCCLGCLLRFGLLLDWSSRLIISEKIDVVCLWLGGCWGSSEMLS
jgi:hypothetical protein